MGFGQAIASYFKNYVTFTGRARRSEYWFAYLFVFLVSLAVCWIPVLGWIWDIAILLPNLSIMVRRLHDIGKHWYWMFMYCIPFAGIVFFFMYTCADSQGDNEWGPSPKYPGAPQYNQPQAAQQYAQPQYGQQQYGQQQYAQPQQAQHYYGQQQAQPQQAQPQYYQPQAAQAQNAQPQYYQPQAAQAQNAQPQYYQPQSAQPQYYQPQAAQAQNAQPQYYQPQAAQPAQPAADANSKPESWN